MTDSLDRPENEYEDASDSSFQSAGDYEWSGGRLDEVEPVDLESVEDEWVSDEIADDYQYYAEAASAYWASQSGGGLEAPYRRGDGSSRVVGTRRALSDALADYWADGVPPDISVLRDGLLMLNAGHELDDSYRALLLRAALYHRHGILTALLHQVDAERTAVIVHDALVEPVETLPARQLDRIVHEDVTYDVWENYLHGELLTTARQYDPARRHLAEMALAVLDGESAYLTSEANAASVAADVATAEASAMAELEESLDRRSRIPIFISLLLASAVLVVAFVVWQAERNRTGEMIALPGGTFTLIDANGVTHAATLTPYFIDPTEVTNGQYRRCVLRGDCSEPDSVASATHRHYYDDPVFDGYPVVHVDWTAASDYCAWKRQRLPTSDEWQLAAGFAPATQRIHPYPWGDLYASGLANDGNSAAGDLLAGGQYRPAGDSLMGLSDMAGNAAEWTATVDLQLSSAIWVKGGSFLDGPEQIRTSAGVAMPADERTAWIGFRCAATPLHTTLMDQFGQ